MKILHTFWSMPIFGCKTSNIDGRFYGGWKDKKCMLMSWALSCLQLNKYYNSIDLITDDIGKYIFLELLSLPYKNVYTSLNVLENTNVNLWALPKLYSYLYQDEPFIHVDGDVFVWDVLRIDHNSPLIAQNEEKNFDYNIKTWHHLIKKLEYIPDYMKDDESIFGSLNSYNAGIFGGTDLEFIKEYSKEAIYFVNKNTELSSLLYTPEFGLIYEQYLFACYSRYRKKQVRTLFNVSDTSFSNITNFHLYNKNYNYIHLFGSSRKKDNYLCHCLERELILNYPIVYKKIQFILKERLL